MDLLIKASKEETERIPFDKASSHPMKPFDTSLLTGLHDNTHLNDDLSKLERKGSLL